jgi:hypothetical protein
MTMIITIRNVINNQTVSIHMRTYMDTSRKYLDLGSIITISRTKLFSERYVNYHYYQRNADCMADGKNALKTSIILNIRGAFMKRTIKTFCKM